MGKTISFNGGLRPAPVRFQTTGNLGVDNIKLVLTVVVTFVVDIIKALKEGNYFALLSILPNLLRYGNIVDLAKLAWEEVKDTDLAESNDVVAHFAATLDLDDDEAEELIEYAVGLLPRIYEFGLRGLTFFTDIQAFVSEVKDKFGAKEATVVAIEKANVGALIAA